MNIGNERIKEWRTILEVSQEDFSEKTGISVKRIQKIEAGEVNASLDDVTAVMDTYYLSADYLCGFEKNPRPIFQNAEEALAWKYLSKLDQEQREAVLASLKNLKDKSSDK